MYHDLCVHSSVSGHPGGLHVLAIVKSAAMSTGVHASFEIMALWPPRGLECGKKGGGFRMWGTHVYLWLIQVDVWQKPLQYCKTIILQS